MKVIWKLVSKIYATGCTRDTYGVEKRMIDYNRKGGVRFTKKVKDTKSRQAKKSNGKLKTITIDVRRTVRQRSCAATQRGSGTVSCL